MRGRRGGSLTVRVRFGVRLEVLFGAGLAVAVAVSCWAVAEACRSLDGCPGPCLAVAAMTLQRA